MKDVNQTWASTLQANVINNHLVNLKYLLGCHDFIVTRNICILSHYLATAFNDKYMQPRPVTFTT